MVLRQAGHRAVERGGGGGYGVRPRSGGAVQQRPCRVGLRRGGFAPAVPQLSADRVVCDVYHADSNDGSGGVGQLFVPGPSGVVLYPVGGGLAAAVCLYHLHGGPHTGRTDGAAAVGCGHRAGVGSRVRFGDAEVFAGTAKKHLTLNENVVEYVSD